MHLDFKSGKELTVFSMQYCFAFCYS